MIVSALLFSMSHLLIRGHWTFEVVATKHRWDVAQKSHCCRNAAVCYLLVSLALFAGVAVDMFIIDLRYIGRTRKRLRRTWEQQQRDVTVASYNAEVSDDDEDEDAENEEDKTQSRTATHSLQHRYGDEVHSVSSPPVFSVQHYRSLLRPRRATRWVLHKLGLRRQGVEEAIVEEKEAGNQHVASLVATQSSLQPVVKSTVLSHVERASSSGGGGGSSWPRRARAREEEEEEEELERDVVHSRWIPRRGALL